jgi:hypothetical protein
MINEKDESNLITINSNYLQLGATYFHALVRSKPYPDVSITKIIYNVMG